MWAASLTDRQLEVVNLVARGLTNVEIAAELGIATRTVKNHLYTIFTRVDVANRTELARWWLVGVGTGLRARRPARRGQGV